MTFSDPFGCHEVQLPLIFAAWEDHFWSCGCTLEPRRAALNFELVTGKILTPTWLTVGVGAAEGAAVVAAAALGEAVAEGEGLL